MCKVKPRAHQLLSFNVPTAVSQPKTAPASARRSSSLRPQLDALPCHALIVCRLDHASNGTDHGTANPIFLLGGALQKQGVLNAAPDLANLDQCDLRHRVGFRSIYASVLKDWLGADDTAILGTGFERIRGLV